MALEKIRLPHHEAEKDCEVLSLGECREGVETLLVVDPDDNSVHVHRREHRNETTGRYETAQQAVVEHESRDPHTGEWTIS